MESIQEFPKFFGHLQQNAKAIIKELEQFDIDDLSYYWEEDVDDQPRIQQWRRLLETHAANTLSPYGLNIIEMLEEAIDR